MTVSRRAFLTGGAGAVSMALAPVATRRVGALAGFAGSPAAGRSAARPNVPWAAGRTRPMPAPSAAYHLLSRASFGPTPAEVARAEAMGAEAWVQEQLLLGSLDDSAVNDALAPLASLGWTAAEMKQNFGTRPVPNELVAATLYRMLHSRRQLFEVLVDHWSNHFNLYHPEELIARVKTLDDRDVVRRHAVGKFRDMLHDSAQSLAMMRYLNTLVNTKAGPNENYAREVMELHTLGVGGGYTEADVKSVARCFTGWNRNNDTWAFEFRSADHEDSAKTVLGTRLASSGVDEGHEVLDLLVDHASCPLHVARRLVRRLVADDAPSTLVTRVAQAFGTDGDIAAMVTALFTGPEFQASWSDAQGAPAKIRRPLEAWCAAMRVLGVSGQVLLNIPADFYEGERPEGSIYAGRVEHYLELMDQLPFRWRAPDGYPDTGDRWGGMHIHVSRWNLGLALVEGTVAGVQLDLVGRMRAAGVSNATDEIVEYWRAQVLQRPIVTEDRALLTSFLDPFGGGQVSEEVVAERVGLLVALLVDSPYFLWR